MSTIVRGWRNCSFLPPRQNWTKRQFKNLSNCQSDLNLEMTYRKINILDNFLIVLHVIYLLNISPQVEEMVVQMVNNINPDEKPVSTRNENKQEGDLAAASGEQTEKLEVGQAGEVTEAEVVVSRFYAFS